MSGGRPVRERDRYARASWREQLAGEVKTLRAHPGVMAILVVLFGGWLFLTITRPPVVHPGDLRVGDCLYIHATDADTDSPTGRPAGTATAAVASLYNKGAERAGCGGSHSHEVVATFVVPAAPGAPYPGSATLLDARAADCSAAFAAWVGRDEQGSTLEPVLAMPPQAAWDAGERAGACLIASRDGQFLTGSAKGSGR